MNISVKSTNISISQAVNDYVAKRLDKVREFVGPENSAQCDVGLSRITGHKKGDVFRAEIHVTGAGMNHFVSAEMFDIYAAIDKARDELLRELRTAKGKNISLIRRSGARVKNMVKGLFVRNK